MASIDVKEETPVDHGEIVCFSIYSGLEADFGHKKSCVWVDVLDGDGKDILKEFAPFFEDPSIKKVVLLFCLPSFVMESVFSFVCWLSTFSIVILEKSPFMQSAVVILAKHY